MGGWIRTTWVGVVIGLWAVGVVAAFGVLWRYGNTPGAQGVLPTGWVAPRALALPDDRPTLVLFAHPRCPCTRATMAALERLQRDMPGAFATRVVFYEPAEADASWRETELWARAGKLVDARAVADPGGRLSAGAGAMVSGHLMLMDVQGVAQFSGGVTPSRGHEGDSVGSMAVRAILRAAEPAHRSTPVYGCSIRGAGCVVSCDDARG